MYIYNKYIISYSVVIGKILGGVIFFILCLYDKNDDDDGDLKFFYEMNIVKYGMCVFCLFTVISFLILCCCFFSLRVRAISKLNYISQ